MDNVERAEGKINAAINGSNTVTTSNNLLLEGIALLLLELVKPKETEEER